MYDVISFGLLKYVMILIMFQAADLKAPIDNRVNAHIKKLASKNITNTTEIQRNVKMYCLGVSSHKVKTVVSIRQGKTSERLYTERKNDLWREN